MSGGPHYKFNINHNTLSADFEVWICGSSDQYFLIPIDIIKQIYLYRGTYIDYHHPEIRVVSVNTQTSQATYARGGMKLDLTPYFLATLH